ncbi:MAG: DUF2142 domain-containing protein [Anaerolineae bacterium]|nr:DUF2142 domain-containing protein [Anaerolineae bacterium]
MKIKNDRTGYPETWPLEKPALVLLVITYLIVGALYAVYTPAWQVPDEPAHYNYVAQLFRDGCCPAMAPGDYDQAYLDELRGAGFDPARVDMSRLDTVQYEDHQPPLYYLLQWPVFALSGGSLTAMRLFSVVMGAGVALCAWAVVRLLFPWRCWLALTAAAFVALLPQHVAMLAGVNNDSLTELGVGALLAAAVLYLRGDDGEVNLPRPHPAVLGALVGLAGLTKTTAYFTLAPALLAVWWRWRQTAPRRRRVLVEAALWVIVVAALLNAPWWLRNIQAYGFPDFTGLARHDAVVVDQPRTGEWIAAHGFAGWLDRFITFTFNSFWGQFGWMALPMPAWVYAVMLVLIATVIGGAVFGIGRNLYKDEDAFTPGQIGSVALLALTLLLVAAQYVLYNLAFVQHQGRYLFPALVPISFVVAIGLDGWTRPLMSEALGRYRCGFWVRWLPAFGLWAGFAALDLYALGRFIIPAFQI